MPGCDEHYLTHQIWKSAEYQPDGSNFDAFMGIELTEGTLCGVTGTFHEPNVYDCDIHNEEYMKRVEEFDKNFPYMEKKILPTQWR